MSGDLTLHYFPVAQPSRALKWLLLLSGAPHKDQIVNIFAGENNTPEFLAKNPAGTVPMLEVNGSFINESGAALIYVGSKYPSKYYPEDLVTRALINEVLLRHDSLSRYVTKELIVPLAFSGKPYEELKVAMAAGSAAINPSHAYLELILTQRGTKFLCGDEPSIADIQTICEYNQLPLLAPLLPEGYADLKEYPKLRAYIELCKTIPHHDAQLAGFNAAVGGMIAAKLPK